MTNEYTIPLKKLFDKPKRGRAKKAIRAVKEFVKKHKRLEEKDVAVSKEVNEKIWANGMFGIPRKIEVELSKIEDKTFVFLKEGKELKEMEKQAKENKKDKKEAKKEEKDPEKEKEKARKLKEKRQKESDAEKAEFKRKQKE